jgi:hypothetical protein
MESPDAERHELEWAIELLGRNTRPGRLLGYLGEKYIQGKKDQLTEFKLATEVFGRSAKTFDSAQDAVVRVETHRLRKKLREIYEKSGRSQGLQVSLPAGTYVPQFSTVSMPLPDVEAGEKLVVQEEITGSAPPRRGGQRALYSALTIAVLGAAIVGAVFLNGSRARSSAAAPSQSAVAIPAANSANGASPEIRLMAGYSGSEVIDNSGARWTPDRFYAGGTPWARAPGFVRRTSRPFLFANWRNGEFGYDLPLPPGAYEMRLFFVSAFRPGDEKLAGFNATLNGKPFMDAFDVNFDALGVDIADEKVFRDVVPDEEGYVRLRFTNQVGTPAINALEIVPGIPHRQRPVRIITQPTSFVDHKGQRWSADDYFLNGFRSTDLRAVSGTEDPELFGVERFGHFSYAIPVDARGRYTVVLHFAEFYFGPKLDGGGGVGSRIFHVFCNGKALLEDFDIFKEAGSLRVITKTFPHVRPSAQGKINLTFEPVANNATVSGIEVLDESE